MLELLWNYILIVLVLGLMKSALGHYWPWIGAWRFDDLHATLEYDESSRLKQFLVNLVFFLVYPPILLHRWCQSEFCQSSTDTEDDIIELAIDDGDDELLRRGMLRGRMIVQKEIILNDGREDELYRRYNDVDNDTVQERYDETHLIRSPSGEPLNLSKDHDPMESRAGKILASTESIDSVSTDSSEDELGANDEILLMQQRSSFRSAISSSSSTAKDFNAPYRKDPSHKTDT
ncbi:uncharacterized protein LOC131207103 [Anopheles bellator]|uniref:uncharacterized protein LOC131207103 n=1 Tax=Anopheles bellator TaxID=139047 RepID=UPI0026473229|nr:uncharacterized protein LOC131207103 [Anopheles bellator]